MDKKIILGVDTCSSRGAIGLVHGDQVLGETSLPVARSFSEKLLPAVDELLRNSRLTLKDIGLFVVSRGPGSFTGIRIGLATLKGLAYTEGVGLVGILSLEALAWGAGRLNQPVMAVLPARPSWVYSAVYQRTEEGIQCLHPPVLESVDDWAGRISSDYLLVGEGVLQYQEMVKVILPDAIIEKDEDLHYPKGAQVALLGWQKFQTLQEIPSQELTPFYLQPSVAEQRWNEKHLEK